MNAMPNRRPVELILADIDADRILPHLYQGAHPPEGPILRQFGFDALVLCALEHQNCNDYPGLRIAAAPMDDCPTVPKKTAHAAARFVTMAIRSGQRVYVACHMGLNRSGLVTALAVRELTGWSGRAAARMVQARRAGALSNEHFLRYVESLPPLGR